MGLCWSALGVFEKAEEYFVRALARDPGHVCWYARQLGRFYGAALDNATADAEKDILGVFKEGFTATALAPHDSAFIVLEPAPP